MKKDLLDKYKIIFNVKILKINFYIYDDKKKLL